MLTFTDVVNGSVTPSVTIGADGSLEPFGTDDLYNFGPLNYFQRPDERYTAGVFADYQVAENADVYGEFMWMDDRSVSPARCPTTSGIAHRAPSSAVP